MKIRTIDTSCPECDGQVIITSMHVDNDIESPTCRANLHCVNCSKNYKIETRADEIVNLIWEVNDKWENFCYSYKENDQNEDDD